MSNWRNVTGKPLSSQSWLMDHHKAKLKERIEFARLILPTKPLRITDLGCGTGLWLEIFNDIAPLDCELVGLDSDIDSIESAKERAKKWGRKSSFKVIDFSKDTDIPESDLYLAFNIFPYLNDPELLLNSIYNSKVNTDSKIIIRQYDGLAMRFGPMKSADRIDIDNLIHTSVSQSSQFRHYDLDRIFEILKNSKFKNKKINFESFHKTSPYEDDFLKYYNNTINWTKNYVNNNSKKILTDWQNKYLSKDSKEHSYFQECYLVASLS